MSNGYDGDIREILRAMVSIGEDWMVAANLLHSLGYHEAHVKYLCGPIVTAEVKFTETTAPAWFAKIIALDRLNLILNEAHAGVVGVYATPIEVLTYCYPHPAQDRVIWQASQGDMWGALYAYLSEEIRRQQEGTPCWELEEAKVVNPARFEAREYLQVASLVRYLVVTRAPYVAIRPLSAYTAPYRQSIFENVFRQ